MKKMNRYTSKVVELSESLGKTSQNYEPTEQSYRAIDNRLFDSDIMQDKKQKKQ